MKRILTHQEAVDSIQRAIDSEHRHLEALEKMSDNDYRPSTLEVKSRINTLQGELLRLINEEPGE